MLRDFDELKALIGSRKKKTVAVAAAHDAHTLEAAFKAHKEGILDYVLIGQTEEIKRIASEEGIELKESELLEARDDDDAARKAVELIKAGDADFIQKGIMQTSTLLRAVVNKETGLNLGRVISHTAILDIPGYDRLLGVADGGMLPAPDLEQKKAITLNAVEVYHRLGYEEPRVAAVCAAETVSPKIQETVDAAALKEAALRGEFGRCLLEGPISFDLAVNKGSARIKGYDSPVSGETDIMIVPTMASGNMMVKAMIEFGGAKMTGVVTGAKCPLAVNSRSASFEEKYYSLVACALIC